ncbi:MAG: hypothetical protein IT464_00290 [Planctomycetes bacterium]|nr:hypothetical protein [Planctomycetota bacterium]
MVIRSKQPDPANPGQFIDDPFIGRSVIWATAEPTDPNVGVAFLTLKRKRIFFVNGESRDSDQPGASNYVTFEVDGALPRGFNAYKWTFTFHLEGVWDAAGNLIDAQDAQGSPIESKFDKTAELHAYTTIGLPSYPWFGVDAPRDRPWVNALAFTGYSCGALGSTTAEEVADRVIRHLHSGTHYQYDHYLGRTFHGVHSAATNAYRVHFNLTRYMLGFGAGNFTWVNCHDQSTAVMCLVNVAAQDGAFAHLLWRYGYVNHLDFVGAFNDCNNPFFLKPQNWGHPVSGDDWTYVLTDFGNGYHAYARSYFGNHSFVFVGAQRVVGDACAGPIVASDGLDISGYLHRSQDTSTAPERVIPWGPGTAPVTDGTSRGSTPLRAIVHLLPRR